MNLLQRYRHLRKSVKTNVSAENDNIFSDALNKENGYSEKDWDRMLDVSCMQQLNFSGIKHVDDKVVKHLLSRGRFVEVVLSDMHAVNTMPEALGVTKLTIDGCYKMDIPSLVLTCPRLVSLNLSRCIQVTDANIKVIALQYTLLTSLHLSQCYKVTDDGISELVKPCKRLVYLNLSFCYQVTGAHLKELKCIESLDLSGCVAVNNTAVQAIIKDCTQLKNLNLSGCVALDEICGRMKMKKFYLSQLLSLNLSNCFRITDAQFGVLLKHRYHLKSLQLERCKDIQPKSLIALVKRNPGLTELNLRGCKQLTNSTLEAIAQTCCQLVDLNLRNCKKISAIHVLKHCTHLVRLDLSNCSKIPEDSFGEIAKNCSKLESIKLTACHHVTDTTLIDLAKGCPLKQVQLQKCKEITDTGVIQLVEHCPGLTSLGLNRLDDDNVTYKGVSQAIRKCTSLTALDVGGLRLKNKEPFLELAKCCPRLVELRAARSSHIDDEIIDNLVKNCPRLKILKLEHCNGIKLLKTIKGVCTNARRLTRLNLYGCFDFTFATIKDLTHVCSQLTWLNISCPNMTKNDLAILLKCLRFLRKLKVRVASEQNKEGFDQLLLDQYKHLEGEMDVTGRTVKTYTYIVRLKEMFMLGR